MGFLISWNWWLRLLVCSLIAAVVVPYLELGFGVSLNQHDVFIEYTSAFFYSIGIGAILSPLSPLVWRASENHPFWRKWLSRAILVITGTAIGCLVAGLFVRLLVGSHYPYWHTFNNAFKIGLVLSVFAVSFLVMYDKYKAQLQVTEMQMKQNELERQKALKLAAQATLSSLESRLHPHFLFNTINSITSLIHDDPQRAEKMLIQMADLLRFSLDSAHSSMVSLEREIKIVTDYLEIEKARFEERLRYRIDIPANLEGFLVPPLSVQTLVENSVKYAVSSRRQGADIQVRAIPATHQLVLQVTDNGPGFPDKHPAGASLPPGHGLRNLQDRLQAIFGVEDLLQIATSSLETTITLTIPNQRASATDHGTDPALAKTQTACELI